MRRVQLAILGLLVLQGCGGGSSSSDVENPASPNDDDPASLVNEDLSPEKPERFASPLKAGVYDYYVTPLGSIDPSEGERVLDRALVTASGASVRNQFSDPTNIGSMTFLQETEFLWNEAQTSHFTSKLRNVTNETNGLVLSDGMFSTSNPLDPDTQLLFLHVESNLDTPLSYKRLSGTYMGASARLADGRTSTFTINTDGVLTGADDMGCIFNGKITIPDPDHSSFDVSFVAENCQGDGNDIPAGDRNGAFRGAGAYAMSHSDQPSIQFYSTNNLITYSFSGER